MGRMRVRRSARAAAVVTAVALLLAGCGTRVDRAEVEAGAPGGAVSLTPESIAALTQPRAAVGEVPAAAAARPGSPAQSAAAAPGTDASATESGKAEAAQADAPAAQRAGCASALAPVALGQIGMFSGVAGPITASMRTTVAAWAADLNSRGGLNCHPVTVFARDDGGDAARSAYLAQDLVDRQNVVAFVASAIFVPNGFQQAIAAAKVPAVGGPGGTAWRASPWVFPEAASIEDQIRGLLRNGVEQGKRKLGLIYCVEVSVCTEAAGQVKAAAGPVGAELLYSAPASITQTDYTAECLNARKAGVDQFMMGLDGASIARVARSCEAIGYRPLLSTSAALFSPAQAQDPLVRAFGVATVTPDAPWMLDDTPGLQEYHRVLARWAPQTQPDGASVIAFTSAKLLEAALANVAAEAARGAITPELIVRGLGGLRNESLGGLTARLNFYPGQKVVAPSSGCTFYLLLGTNGWSTPKGSRPVCEK